jgi:hypothetical protein
MDTQETLITTIKTISDEYWAQRETAALLSGLPKMLETKIPDYRSILGVRSLKAFIKETESDETYKLIEHPTLKAKIGVAPTSADFAFPQEPPLQSTRSTAVGSNQAVTIAFLRALATLPESDIDKVVIPASVLTKLLK